MEIFWLSIVFFVVGATSGFLICSLGVSTQLWEADAIHDRAYYQGRQEALTQVSDYIKYDCYEDSDLMQVLDYVARLRSE